MSISATHPILQVEEVSAAYRGNLVLDRVDFSLPPAESLAVVGRSGSGKSTLLACILGMLKPRTGRVVVDGSEMQAGRRSAARLRRERIGMIFQGGELISELTPLENIVIAGLLGGLPPDQANARANDLLERLEVPQRAQTTSTFSGGERQRIAVARALVNQPLLVLADEPTASLDDQTKEQVCDLLHSLPSAFGCSLVVVTHESRVATACTRTARLVDGRLTIDRPTPVAT